MKKGIMHEEMELNVLFYLTFICPPAIFLSRLDSTGSILYSLRKAPIMPKIARCYREE